MYNTYQGVTINGGRLAFYGGPEPSDYIETRKGIFCGKEGLTLSDYETLSIVLMVLAIVVTLLIALVESKK